MTACPTCGGYGMRHDPIAHDFDAHLQREWQQRQTIYESHIWSPQTDGDEDECGACGVTWTDCGDVCPGPIAHGAAEPTWTDCRTCLGDGSIRDTADLDVRCPDCLGDGGWEA